MPEVGGSSPPRSTGKRPLRSGAFFVSDPNSLMVVLYIRCGSRMAPSVEFHGDPGVEFGVSGDRPKECRALRASNGCWWLGSKS